jgi:hypothetical protein
MARASFDLHEEPLASRLPRTVRLSSPAMPLEQLASHALQAQQAPCSRPGRGRGRVAANTRGGGRGKRSGTATETGGARRRRALGARAAADRSSAPPAPRRPVAPRLPESVHVKGRRPQYAGPGTQTNPPRSRVRRRAPHLPPRKSAPLRETLAALALTLEPVRNLVIGMQWDRPVAGCSTPLDPPRSLFEPPSSGGVQRLRRWTNWQRRSNAETDAGGVMRDWALGGFSWRSRSWRFVRLPWPWRKRSTDEKRHRGVVAAANSGMNTNTIDKLRASAGPPHRARPCSRRRSRECVRCRCGNRFEDRPTFDDIASTCDDAARTSGAIGMGASDGAPHPPTGARPLPGGHELVFRRRAVRKRATRENDALLDIRITLARSGGSVDSKSSKNSLRSQIERLEDLSGNHASNVPSGAAAKRARRDDGGPRQSHPEVTSAGSTAPV